MQPVFQTATLFGVLAGLVGSPIGGMLSDKTAAAHHDEPEARLIHNTLINLALMPAGLLLFGWTIQVGWLMGCRVRENVKYHA